MTYEATIEQAKAVLGNDWLELEVEVYLGGDTDCDTCGSTYNRLRYVMEIGGDITWHDIAVYEGCYGGRSINTRSAGEAYSFVRKVQADYPGAASVRGLLSFLAGLA